MKAITDTDKKLSQEWNNFWSTQYRTINFEMQCNLNSHQGKVTFDLLRNYKTGSLVLEAGCGLGNWTFIFKQMGFKPIGIDLSFSSLKIAWEYCQKNSFDSLFVLADIRKIPIRDNYFDLVVSYGVVEHFVNSVDAVNEFYRVLKPGGACLVTTPNPFSFHRLIGRYLLNITKSYKLGYIGYEKAFTPKGLSVILSKSGFMNIESGILSDGMGTLFGVFWPAIPLVGKGLHKFFTRLAAYIEKKQNVIGGGSYAIGYKYSAGMIK